MAVGTSDLIAPRRVCPRCFAVYRAGFTRCPVDGTELETLERDHLLGVMLSGTYVVEALLGEGAIGRVYRARHALLSREFAVKVMFGDVAANEITRQRFVREAEAASRLTHDNIVGLVDFGQTKAGLLYIVMDLIDGETLEALVEREGPLPEATAARYAAQLLRALQYAHDSGVIHRDLKPANIVVERHGAVRVLDFGVAYVIDPGTEERERLTKSGCVVGTPLFMAPEQAFGRDVTASSDLYSVGVVLYYLVAGVTPFDASAMTLAQLMLKDRLPPIAERAPDVVVSDHLLGVIDALTARDPKDRPASAAEALAMLQGTQDLMAEEVVVEAPRQWPIVLGAIAFVLAGAILVFALLS
ncbi:MAG: serine/threonine-protein kinase [Deltaproteobacteria bacterium]|jgi:serine/threonine protein kinase